MRILGSVLAGTALTAALFFGLGSNEADAKGAYDSAYGFDRTWNAGMRLVRVDMNMKLTEKDESAGYLLFEYTSPESGKKPVPGSMEFIRAKDGAVRVLVQIPAMPGYHEQVLVDALAKKMRNEYGDPPKKAPPPSAPKDAGAEDGGDPNSSF